MKTITFTGGLGAQILSASAYFYLEKIGTPVRASLDYFNLTHHVATPGNKGEISVWKWELHTMSIFPNRFDQTASLESEYVHDGEEKIRLGFLGLRDPEIRSKFPILDEIKKIKKDMFGEEDYICVHIRRGDYLNVSSFLIDYESFFDCIVPFSKILPRILVISDSPFATSFLEDLKSLKVSVKGMMGGEPIVAHSLMRLSKILICSNSQLSYTAAALRSKSDLTILPSQHDSDPNSPTNEYLKSIRKFQVIAGYM